MERLIYAAKEEISNLDLRFLLAALIIVLVIGSLLVRLWFLQIYHGTYYADLSLNNRVKLRYISPLRGKIYDRQGTLLVSNRPSFDVCVDLDERIDWTKVSGKLSPILGMTEDELLARIDTGERDQLQNTVRLKSDISWLELSQIETNRYDLPGVIIQVEPKRDYIYPGLASHIVGFLGEINKNELMSGDYKNVQSGEYIGKSGVEKTLGDYLRGSKGGRQVEVDASGREVRTIARQNPIAGDDIYLTLDLSLQEKLQEELEGQVGAIVAIRPSTGEILAMASSPTFDQNTFVRGMTPESWKEITSNPYKPLQNKAIQGQYPPGSVFKVIMALAGLQENVITEQTPLKCTGQHRFGNRVYHCWKKWGHGAIKLEDALAQSCDIYFYQVGQMLGVDKIAEYARMFGLSQPTAILLDHEMPGLIPTSAWKLKRFNVPWQKGETLSLAIGQSFTLVTPLQVARFMAAVANNGYVMKPRLVRKITDNEGRTIRLMEPEIVTTLPFSKTHLSAVRKALKEAVNGERGTGKKAQVKGLTVAGKTGTVQVVAIKDAMNRRKLEDMPYEHRDHAWFTCFAPYEDPDIALAIIIEHGGHGGSTAAPVAQRIFKSYFEHHETSGEVLTRDWKREPGKKNNG